MMGAYENAMHEEGSVDDFHREIQRMILEMRRDRNRAALYDMFFACRKIELEHRRKWTLANLAEGADNGST